MAERYWPAMFVWAVCETWLRMMIYGYLCRTLCYIKLQDIQIINHQDVLFTVIREHRDAWDPICFHQMTALQSCTLPARRQISLEGVTASQPMKSNT